MPVITPAFPSMCATHNVTPSTQHVVQRELERAFGIAEEIFAGKKTWKDLFQRHTFFTHDYKYYLSIIAASRTKEANSIWSGYVQSRVRRLVTGIEQSGAGVAIAHPFNKGFERVHRCKQEDVDKVLQGDLSFQVKEIKTETTDEPKDVKQAVAAEGKSDDKLEMPVANGIDKVTDPEGFQTIWTATYYLGIGLEEGASRHDYRYPFSDRAYPMLPPSLSCVLTRS
jgi:poly(A) polymerase